MTDTTCGGLPARRRRVLRAGLLLWLCQAGLLVASAPAWALHDLENEQFCPELRMAFTTGASRAPIYEFFRGGNFPSRREVTWVSGQPIEPIIIDLPSRAFDVSIFNEVEQWEVSPPLPAGITITRVERNGNATIGQISGTPTGTLFNRRVYEVTGRNCHGVGQRRIITPDGDRAPASGPLILIVSIVSGAPDITTPSPPIVRRGVVGMPLTPITFTNTGGPGRWSIDETLRLPRGLSLDPATGAISGTPIETTPQQERMASINVDCPEAGCTYGVFAVNGAGRSETVTFQLAVVQAPDIADIANPVNALSRTAIAAVEFANRGSAPTGCSASPALPAGLAVEASGGTCRIRGTPLTAAARAQYTVTASNAAGADTASVTLAVRDAPAPGNIVVSIARTDSGNLIEAPNSAAEGPQFEAVFAVTLNGPPLRGAIDIPFRVSGPRIRPGRGGDFYVFAGDSGSDNADNVLSVRQDQHNRAGSTTHTIIVGAEHERRRVFETDETFTVTLDTPIGAAASQVRLSNNLNRLSASATIAGDNGSFQFHWPLVNLGGIHRGPGGFHLGRITSNPTGWVALREGDTAEFQLALFVTDSGSRLSTVSETPLDLLFRVEATDHPAPYNNGVSQNPACCPDLGVNTGSFSYRTAGGSPRTVTNGMRVRFPAFTSQITIRIPILEDGVAEPPIPEEYRRQRADVNILTQRRATNPSVGNVELELLEIVPVDEDAPAPALVAPPRIHWPITASGQELTYELSGPATLAGAASGTYTVTLGGVSGAGLPGAQTLTWTATAGSGDNPATAADFGGSFPGGTLSFADGASSDTTMTFAVAATGASSNNRNEADKTFVLNLSTSDTPDPRFNGNGLVVRITDPDAIAVSLARADSGTLTEGAAGDTGNAVFTVTLSGGQLSADASIPYAIGGAGITAGDVSATGLGSDSLSGTLTITAASSTSATTTADITVTALADNLNEDMETLTLTLGGAPATAGPIALTDTETARSATASIAASDPVTVSIARASATPATVTEGDNAGFTVTLSGASEGSAAGITVLYAATGTSDAPTDANGGNITILAGQTTGAIVLGIPFNQMLGADDDDQTLTVSLSSLLRTTDGGGAATLAAAPNDSATVMVNYVDAAHTIAFSSPAATIVEGAAATYTVSRAGPVIVGGTIAVGWTYAAGTAVAADFRDGNAPAGGTLIFRGNETTKTFTIATQEDTDSEPGETFSLGLTAENAVLRSNGGVALPNDIAVTIGESDRPVMLNIAAPAGDLSEGAAANFTVRFTDSVITTEAVTAAWTIAFPAASATVNPAAAADFATRRGTVSIPAGASSANIPITASADNLNEAAESFSVTLSAPGGGGAIAAPRLGAAAAATAGIAESNPITVSIAPGAATVNEGGNAEFTVTLSGASAGSAANIAVAYTATGGADTPTDANRGSITIPAGQATGTIVLGIPFNPMLGDDDADQTLMVTLGTITPAAGTGAVATHATNNSATMTINYVDAAHTIAFSSPAAAIMEGAAAVYTVTRRGPAIAAGNSIAVSWTYAAGTTAAADFAGGAAPAGGMLIFRGSETTKTFTIATQEDTDSEPRETFTLGLTAAPAVLASNDGVALPGNITAAIGESDRPVMLGITAPAGLSEGTAAMFAVNFSESVTTTEAVTARWTISFPGASTASAADFATRAGTVSIPAGTNSANISITAAADNLNEAAETFTVTLSNPAGGGAIAAPGLANATATATIAASNPIAAAVAAPAPATAFEGEDIVFAVNLNGASAGSAAGITVAYTVTAAAGSPGGVPPFTDAGNGMLTIAPRTGAGTITVRSTPTPDIDTGTGTLSVRIDSVTAAAGGGMAGGSGSATVTVTFRAFERFFAVAVGSATPREGDSVVFDVSFTPGSTPPVPGIPATVDWAIAGDVQDYSGEAAGTLVFNTLVSQAVRITITDDDLIEGNNDMLTFTIRNAAGGGGTGTGITTDAQTITITDNDAITVSIRGPNSLNEESTAAYIVDLGARVLTPTMVTLATDGATAATDTTPGDFTLSGPSVAVAALARSDTFTVTTTDGGGEDTPDRMLTMTATVMAPDMPVAPGILNVTIREDDPVARTQRVKQATTALNRAAVALAVPVIARRFDPEQDPEGPGVALNFDGRQLLVPAARGAAAAGGGADGYALIGLPREGATDRGQENASGADSAPPAAPAMPTAVARAAIAMAHYPPVDDPRQGPPLLGLASLDLGALAELAAAELEGLDSVAPSNESRSMRQLLGHSSFSATSDRGGGNTLTVWGRGSYTSLEGEPQEGETRYDYDGDNYAFHLGLDYRYGDFLAGAAVGYTVGELELRAAGAPAGERSDFRSNIKAVYPYAAWQPSERLSLWLLAGYGQGTLRIEERDGDLVGKATSDTDLWLGGAGLSWRQPTAGGSELLLRLSGTALHGETDGGIMRYDSGRIQTYNETKTEAQQVRGEGELGRFFDFGDGGRLRPHLKAGLSYDFGDGSYDAGTAELGGGFRLRWPRLGLEAELESLARLTRKGDRDYQEYSVTGILNYDLDGDRRGLQFALHPSFGLERGLAGGLPGAAALDGGAFSSAGSGFRGGGYGDRLGLRGELSYGIADVRPLLGMPGLLTLYGASGLRSGANSYSSGLRFEAARFTMDAGLRYEGGAASNYEFLLDSAFRF